MLAIMHNAVVALAVEISVMSVCVNESEPMNERANERTNKRENKRTSKQVGSQAGRQAQQRNRSMDRVKQDDIDYYNH